MSEKPFFIDYDKRGAAKCKKCKEKMEKGNLRIAKIVTNPFSDEGGTMKQWYHVHCLFDTFKRARATTKKIEDPLDDIEGWDDLSKDDQKLVQDKIKEYGEHCGSQPTPKKKIAQNTHKNLGSSPKGNQNTLSATPLPKNSNYSGDPGQDHKDNSFKEFRKLCARIAEESSYLEKTAIVSNFFEKGTDGESFKGDLHLWVRMLLPGVVKRVYNLQSRQLTKLFSQLFNTSQDEMLEDLEKGDIAETVRVFFEASDSLSPAKKCGLTLFDVDHLLSELEGQTTEEAHLNILRKAAKRSTGNDLKMIVRLIKGDLRINAGAKHILEGIHSEAYEAFQNTRNLNVVLDEILSRKSSGEKASNGKELNIQAKVMTPVLPMLAQPCRSIEDAFKKSPNGMFAEIKYDGERVQLHKEGGQFKYFSRSLKPVMAHKVSHFKEFIPEAFPLCKSLILDAEILLIDTNTSLPLPFGTLGKHKKEKFQDANVCLFVFDCLHMNGENLMDRPITERRKILEKNIVEIKNRVVLSELLEIRNAEQLQKMIHSVLKQGLEGLVLKDKKSIYEPGKRHWLKVKKDYLQDGAMADSADLVVLGAWYGTGKKGGMMSVFLMGCYDPSSGKWCTVTKVHTGHDDAALERLQTELKMDKISQDYDSLPAWIKCARSLTPDFVAKDPKKSPVWEITGAEFTKNKIHTAHGISIRFPRVTKERRDKNWQNATDLVHLMTLYEASKEHTDITGLQSDSESSHGNGHGSTSSPKNEDDNRPKDTKKSPSNDSKQSSKKKSKEKTPKVNEKSPQTATNNKRENGESKSPKKFIQPTLNEIIVKGKKKRKLELSNESGNAKKALKVEPFAPPVKEILPNTLEGIRIFLPETMADFALLKRYLIAFGGKLVDEFDKDATHRLQSPSTQNYTYGKTVVTVDWLWDKIANTKV